MTFTLQPRHLTALIFVISTFIFGSNEGIHGIDTSAIDSSVHPGNDFFSYANGNWVKTTEIPSDQPRWGTFSILREESVRQTADLLSNPSKNPSPSASDEKAIDFYASFMDEAAIEKKGLLPLKDEMNQIAAISNKQELARGLGSTLRADVDALNSTNFYTENIFGLWTSPGFADADHYTPYLLQGGPGMPDREYYISDNPKMAEMRKAYQAHISAVLKLANISNADAKVARIFAL